MGIATVGIIPAQLMSIIFGWSYMSANVHFTGFFVGVLLMFCNLLTGLFTGFAIVMLHMQILLIPILIIPLVMILSGCSGTDEDTDISVTLFYSENELSHEQAARLIELADLMKERGLHGSFHYLAGDNMSEEFGFEEKLTEKEIL